MSRLWVRDPTRGGLLPYISLGTLTQVAQLCGHPSPFNSMAKASKNSAQPKRRATKRADDSAGSPGSNDPFVVGVGASAGGLQALQTFFGAMKEIPHAAFVV